MKPTHPRNHRLLGAVPLVCLCLLLLGCQPEIDRLAQELAVQQCACNRMAREGASEEMVLACDKSAAEINIALRKHVKAAEDPEAAMQQAKQAYQAEDANCKRD